MNSTNSKTLIFDFDGTIADTFEISLKSINEIVVDFNIKPIDLSDVERLRDKSAREILAEYRLSFLTVIRIARRFKSKISEHIDEIKPFDGFEKSLQQLKSNGFKMYIVTSNSKENVEKFLENNNLKYFDDIYSSSILGKHRSINKLIKREKLSKENAIYIGDELRDIEAARKSGIKIASVGWGYNSKQVLQEHNPDLFINRVEDLETQLSSLK